jgi:SRSO17 transposase
LLRTLVDDLDIAATYQISKCYPIEEIMNLLAEVLPQMMRQTDFALLATGLALAFGRVQ